MVNMSASPFVVGKHRFRLDLFASQVRQFRKPLVYVNQVGGNDELVFDGNSVVMDADGNVLAQGKDFEEDLLIVDLPRDPIDAGKPVLTATTAEVQHVADRTLNVQAEPKSDQAIESIHKALVLGSARLCRQVRLQERRPWIIRRHRFGADGGIGRRGVWAGQGRRRRHAQPL